MLSYFSTIRAKLLASFFFFLVIILFISFVNIWFDWKEQKINALLDRLSEINSDIQKSNKLEKGFFDYEIINSKFYISGNSRYLRNRAKTIAHVKLHLDSLKKNERLGADDKVDKLMSKFASYEVVFAKMVKAYKERGFKDYGLVGKMREYIHYIEEYKDQLDLAKVLMVRRHEKDFIIRRDLRYTEKMAKTIRQLRENVAQRIKEPRLNAELLKTVDYYHDAFKKLVALDQRIGLNDQDGLRVELSKASGDLEAVITDFNRYVHARASSLKKQNRILLSTVMVLGIGLMIFLAFFLTRILSRPIHRLSASIQAVVENDFSREVAFEKVFTNDEIGRLSKDFNFMLTKMQNSLDKVKKSSEEIKRKRDLLLTSINYARKIQSAILPTEEEIRAFFPENFVIYSPMHVVSGDFYWIGKRKKKLFLAVVDCTGHGVPGGFMSMIGNILLNEIIIQHKTFAPAQVLEQLDQEIHHALRQNQNLNNDGMDVSLIMVEKIKNGIVEEEDADAPVVDSLTILEELDNVVAAEQEEIQSFKVTFAGAKNSMFYCKDNDLTEIKGTRRSIGGRRPLHKDSFADHEIILDRGTNLYFTTDGLLDQHNQARKKFSKRRFVQIIKANKERSMPEQQEALKGVMFDYMGQEPQRDDITVVGVKL
ncbi:MAG TPA: hypothetical protein DCS93_27825 [Microscillaceae bacterium]|nr:hypothetical protein [Microscillaceae bacterium]